MIISLLRFTRLQRPTPVGLSPNYSPHKETEKWLAPQMLVVIVHKETEKWLVAQMLVVIVHLPQTRE